MEVCTRRSKAAPDSGHFERTQRGWTFCVALVYAQQMTGEYSKMYVHQNRKEKKNKKIETRTQVDRLRGKTSSIALAEPGSSESSHEAGSKKRLLSGIAQFVSVSAEPSSRGSR
mmetsp:Transcript_12228/g.32949  ORF Transcript_12228/g.32949 Transcript_12228/m.32949 type:complete len:114 (-) Transcript_12228:1064-1405(-)